MWLQVGPTKCSNGGSIGDIEDLIHNFLIIMLEHSMRQKDGWKVSLHWYSHSFVLIAPPKCWLKLTVVFFWWTLHILLSKTCCFFPPFPFVLFSFNTMSARYDNGTGRTCLVEKKSHIKHNSLGKHPCFLVDQHLSYLPAKWNI